MRNASGLTPVVVVVRSGERIKGLLAPPPSGWTILKVKEIDRTRVVDDVTELDVNEVDAVFFVRDLVRERRHREQPPDLSAEPPQGMVRLHLRWGEVMQGRLMRGQDPRLVVLVPAPGFDRNGNILRAWLKRTAIVRLLGHRPGAPGPPKARPGGAAPFSG